MVKGASATYGPQSRPDKNGDVRDLDILRLMYAKRAGLADKDGFDLDDFLSSGEEYQGETHLAILCSFDALMLVVKRIHQGLEGFDEETRQPRQLDAKTHVKRLKALVRVLRHVETFSCWRDEGTDEKTGKTFLFPWPKEQALFPNSFHAFSVQERAYDEEWHNAFGLKFRANPVLEEDEPHGPDDTVHPADAKRRTAREHNTKVRQVNNGNLIGQQDTKL